MAIKRMKSPDYLDFLGGKRCVVSGKSPVTNHHESVTRMYTGGMKKYFDFGAMPMNHETHLYERHGWGKAEFWRYYEKNPVDIVIELIQEYIDEGREDIELAENALEMVREDNGYNT